MNERGKKRLKKELDIYNKFKIKNMPIMFYNAKSNEFKYLNITLKIPNDYPFSPPLYHYESKDVYKNVKPGNIRALLFCGELMKIAPINLLDPNCCVYCSSLHCVSNYNISTSLTSFFVESILLYKYMILTSALHLRYVEKLFESFSVDILHCIIENF
tara:strand:+ start:69 stop:542 length:474 start_codon:yes stop_codon:yes gene_type:complete